MTRGGPCIFLSLSFSLLSTSFSSSHSHIRHSVRLSHSLFLSSFSLSRSFSLALSASLFLCVFLSLSHSRRGDSVLQVVRPPIGGRGRRCAWVGEAWCPPPIGHRALPTPEVGRRRRKEGRNEGGEEVEGRAPPLGRARAKTISHLARNVAKTCQVAFRLTLRVTAFCTQTHSRTSPSIRVTYTCTYRETHHRETRRRHATWYPWRRGMHPQPP